jgi:hypothetical protein
VSCRAPRHGGTSCQCRPSRSPTLLPPSSLAVIAAGGGEHGSQAHQSPAYAAPAVPHAEEARSLGRPPTGSPPCGRRRPGGSADTGAAGLQCHLGSGRCEVGREGSGGVRQGGREGNLGLGERGFGLYMRVSRAFIRPESCWRPPSGRACASTTGLSGGPGMARLPCRARHGHDGVGPDRARAVLFSVGPGPAHRARAKWPSIVVCTIYCIFKLLFSFQVL